MDRWIYPGKTFWQNIKFFEVNKLYAIPGLLSNSNWRLTQVTPKHMHAEWPVTSANLLNLRDTEGYYYMWVQGITYNMFMHYNHLKLLEKGLEQIYTLVKKYPLWKSIGILLVH